MVKDFAMAEINKLSVGQALDKLRRTIPKSKQARLHEKMDGLDDEIQRMRATRRRLERDQRAAESTGNDAQRANEGRANKKGSFSMPVWMVLAIVGSLLVILVICATR